MANTNPKIQTSAFTMRVDPEFLRAVEELRRFTVLSSSVDEPIPTKSDVIREAVMEALKRAKAKGKK